MVNLLWALLALACIAGVGFTAYRLIAFLAGPAGRERSRRAPYRIERATATPVEADALAIAIMGAGFHVVERRRSLLVSRAHGGDPAIVRLPWSRVVGEAVAIEACDRDLVLGLMTAMSAVLGTLRLETAELGEVVVSAPTGAASPDAQRSWAATRRPRVASHYALDESWQRRRRR